MSHYKPYPAYKDSGVEWIGKVPEHWDVVRIKRTAQIATDRCNAIPSGLPYIGLEDVESGSGQYKPTAATSRQSEDSTIGLFRAGDVLYGKLRPYLRKCISISTDGACSTEFLVLKPASLSPAWLQYWLLTHDVTQQIEAGCDGAKMPRADWEHVGSIHIPIPEKGEQDFILATLDLETTRIDALLAKKTEFIDLLSKKRQALITHAVTKGLDQNVKMKDSGVEWIGEVPAEWERRKISHSFTQIGSGTTPPTGQHEWYSDSGIPWVTTGELRENVITGTTKYVTPDAIEEFSALRIYPVGALAIAMYGATIGRLGILGVQAATNQACCVLAGEIFLSVRFAYYWLLASKQPIIDLYAVGGGQPNINQEIIANLRVPAPGIDEQREITNFLDGAVARIDLLTEKTQLSIDLLKERRSALIIASVTGQIDVREAVEMASDPT